MSIEQNVLFGERFQQSDPFRPNDPNSFNPYILKGTVTACGFMLSLLNGDASRREEDVDYGGHWPPRGRWSRTRRRTFGGFCFGCKNLDCCSSQSQSSPSGFGCDEDVPTSVGRGCRTGDWFWNEIESTAEPQTGFCEKQQPELAGGRSQSQFGFGLGMFLWDRFVCSFFFSFSLMGILFRGRLLN